MQVLIVDDKQSARMLLNRFVSRCGHTPVTVSDGRAALEILQSEPIGLLISDWVMPNMDGLELCRTIRSTDFGRYIYIILCSAKNQPRELVEGMEAGADDFITKPVDPKELHVRIRAGERIVRLEQRLQEQNAQLEILYEQLSSENIELSRRQKQLKRQARTDFLTGVANRRDFEERLQVEFEKARALGTELTVLLLDIDHFKRINDTCGHMTGDLALKQCADTLKGVTRKGDFVGRYGGDEFVCIFSSMSLSEAQTIAERVQERMGRLRLPVYSGTGALVTVSIGLAQIGQVTKTTADLMMRADKALYSAKQQGRDLALIDEGAA